MIVFHQSISELYCNVVVAVDELFPAVSDSFSILVVIFFEAHQSIEISCTTKDVVKVSVKRAKHLLLDDHAL